MKRLKEALGYVLIATGGVSSVLLCLFVTDENIHESFLYGLGIVALVFIIVGLVLLNFSR